MLLVVKAQGGARVLLLRGWTVMDVAGKLWVGSGIAVWVLALPMPCCGLDNGHGSDHFSSLTDDHLKISRYFRKIRVKFSDLHVTGKETAAWRRGAICERRVGL